MGRRTVSPHRGGLGVALAVLAVSGCSTTDDVSAVPTPVPTGAIAASEASCGLDPVSVDAVTGLPAESSDEHFTGGGAALRGRCEVHDGDIDPVIDVVSLTVDDASSEYCVWRREIVEGRGGWPETARFETLDGGVWAQVEPSDQQRSVGPSSVAFVGDLCIGMNLATMAPGRDPVREAEALTMQAIATLGLVGS